MSSEIKAERRRQLLSAGDDLWESTFEWLDDPDKDLMPTRPLDLGAGPAASGEATVTTSESFQGPPCTQSQSEGLVAPQGPLVDAFRARLAGVRTPCEETRGTTAQNTPGLLFQVPTWQDHAFHSQRPAPAALPPAEHPHPQSQPLQPDQCQGLGVAPGHPLLRPSASTPFHTPNSWPTQPAPSVAISIPLTQPMLHTQPTPQPTLNGHTPGLSPPAVAASPSVDRFAGSSPSPHHHSPSIRSGSSGSSGGHRAEHRRHQLLLQHNSEPLGSSTRARIAELRREVFNNAISSSRSWFEEVASPSLESTRSLASQSPQLAGICWDGVSVGDFCAALSAQSSGQQARSSWQEQLSALDAHLSEHNTGGAAGMIVLDTEAVQRSLSVLWSRLEEALEAVGEAEGHKREREALEHKVRFLEQELAGLRTVAEEAEGLKLQLARCEREREQYERSEQREQQQGGPSGLEEEVRSLRADLQTLNAYLGDLEKDLEDRDNRISQLKDEATSR